MIDIKLLNKDSNYIIIRYKNYTELESWFNLTLLKFNIPGTAENRVQDLIKLSYLKNILPNEIDEINISIDDATIRIFRNIYREYSIAVYESVKFLYTNKTIVTIQINK